jgi:hypothetical protein
MTFQIGSITIPYFYHDYNCGHPGGPQVERVVEMAVADYWLKQCFPVVEIGAVTPYYWPGRVATVIDPQDEKATHRDSMFVHNFAGQNVLSISTIEHIGTGDYGIAEPEVSGPLALWKLIAESSSMLVTVPCGQSGVMDAVVYNGNVDQFCNAYFLTREPGGEVWTQTPRVDAVRWYGRWANSVAILEKGAVFG